MGLIKPSKKGEELLLEMKQSNSSTEYLKLWWLGQSGFLLQHRGSNILVDPYLSDSLTEKYKHTDKPHVRMTELVLDPSKLDFIDVVSSSHNHTDHLDPVTLQALATANPNLKMIAPRANRKLVLERSQLNESSLLLLNASEGCQVNEHISFYGIPAMHNEFEVDDTGDHKFMGFVIQIGEYSIYHSGDTLYHTSIVEAVSKFDIDIAILPINGNIPQRKVAGNFNSAEAIEMAKQIDAKLLIPCHYHMFEFNSVEPDEFIEIAHQNKQGIKVLLSGEKYTYSHIP